MKSRFHCRHTFFQPFCKSCLGFKSIRTPNQALSDPSIADQDVDSDSDGYESPPPATEDDSHGVPHGVAYGKPSLTSFGMSFSHEEAPALPFGKGKGNGKGKGKGEFYECEEDKEERRKKEAQEAAKTRAISSIPNAGRNLRGTPFIVVDKVTGEEFRVDSARAILTEVIRRLEPEDEGNDLEQHASIIKKGPQLTLSTIVNFLAAFRMGPPDEDGNCEGGVIDFDQDQKPQEAADALGDPRFDLFRVDSETDDDKGEQVEIAGHYARNMRIMGDRVLQARLVEKG